MTTNPTTNAASAHKSKYATGLNADARNEIKRLMRDAGVSRAELARMLGVNRVCVTQMFDANRNLTLHTLEKVVGLLGHTVHICCHEQPKRCISRKEAND